MEQLSMEKFLIDFKPSFENFLSKCPRKVKSTLVDNGKLYLEILNEKGISIDGFNFTLNPIKSKKEQIREIKEKLEHFYPTITEEKSESYSVEEIKEMLANNVSLEEALGKRKKVFIERYILVRVHHRYNELDCFDKELNVLKKYKLYKMPTTIFMDKVLSDPKEASLIFKQNAKYIHDISKK